MKKFIIYSDFDGTITTHDAFDKIIVEVYSYATYKKLEQLMIENKLSAETYLEMFNGIHYAVGQRCR
jgi:2-hydroxy-3-keto-5-methylthiopentenyl-1-phosphate phosphatase